VRFVRIAQADLADATFPNLVRRLATLLATPARQPRRFTAVRTPEPGTQQDAPAA
jgi:hypothetical protein